MTAERLTIRYVPLAQVSLWDRNPKPHDIGAIIQSIKRHGFKDAPKFEPKLNKGKGGIVAGNGRIEAVARMKRDGMKPPRGIETDEHGEWLVPIQFGVDAKSAAAAEAYGIDHNSLTVMGGDFGPDWQSRLYDRERLVEILGDLATAKESPVSIDPDDLDALAALESAPAKERPREPAEREREPEPKPSNPHMVTVAVGRHTFEVPLFKFSRWESELLAEVEGIDDEVPGEIRRRLGMEE